MEKCFNMPISMIYALPDCKLTSNILKFKFDQLWLKNQSFSSLSLWRECDRVKAEKEYRSMRIRNGYRVGQLELFILTTPNCQSSLNITIQVVDWRIQNDIQSVDATLSKN